MGNLYVFFEYPGLVAATAFTFIYLAALITYWGLFSPFTVVIGFTTSIGIYFFFRTWRFALELKISEVQVRKKEKSLGD